MRMIGVTAGETDPRSTICFLFSRYCRQSRSALMSYGLCSASKTTPSYLAVASSIALSMVGGEKTVMGVCPCSRRAMTELSRSACSVRL